MIFVGRISVVTVRHGEHGGLSEVRKRMDAGPEHLRLDRMRCARSPFAWSTATSVTNLIRTDIDSIESSTFAPGLARHRTDPICSSGKWSVAPVRESISTAFSTPDRARPHSKKCELLFDVADHQTGRRPDRADDMLQQLNCRPRSPRSACSQKHAQDIAWAGYHRSHHDRGHLWHELSLHARADSGGVTDSDRQDGRPLSFLYHVFRNRNWLWLRVGEQTQKLQILRRGGGLCRSPPWAWCEWSGSHRVRRRTASLAVSKPMTDCPMATLDSAGTLATN